MNKVCYIISAGECAGININKNVDDYIIAVDGGYKYAIENHLVPDMVLGDFDSLGYVPDEKNVVVHQTEKDDTDTMLAVLEGIRLGYKEFRIFGALGGRLDHTFANIQVLTFLSKRGMRGTLVDSKCVVTAITNNKLIMPDAERGTFSVFSVDGEAKGVSIKGAKYEIENHRLTNDRALGISNEFVGNDVEISVKQGTLLVFEML